MVTVPQFVPSVLALRQNPTFMYFMDRFQKPYPFKPDVAVRVDDQMESKWKMFDAMESQFYEWLAWHAGILDSVPKKKAERITWLQETWGPRFMTVTNTHREALHQWYSRATVKEARYAEFFELSEYGHQPTRDDLKRLFPFGDDRA